MHMAVSLIRVFDLAAAGVRGAGVGSRTAEPASSPLRHKFVAPGIPRGSIARPRLDRQLSELFDTYSVVEIVAAPGSGKTVQAQLYAASCGRAVAWLTMD